VTFRCDVGRAYGEGMVLGYLDHAASSPMSAECRDAMMPWLTGAFGNPSGSHAIARAARAAIEDARDVVAGCLGARPGEVVFTGGGTEALNLAIAGATHRRFAQVGANQPGGSTILTSAIEHDAVRNAAARVLGDTHLDIRVDSHGVVDLAAFEEQLHTVNSSAVRLVAVMAVNNEIGTIQPIPQIVDAVRRLAPTALLLCDSVQGAVWIDVASHCCAADLLVISAHKFGGPQGVGALVVRPNVALTAQVHGGGQEQERRSGTQNVAGIVGMAAALQATVSGRTEMTRRVSAMRDRLVDGLLAQISGAIETSPRSVKVAGNAHICVPGIESESLLVLLDDGGVCASAGSACASGAIHTSPVLQAMGVSQTLAEGALRLTLGDTTIDADIDLVLKIVPEAVARLRN
jgi:cysteine desulfurase